MWLLTILFLIISSYTIFDKNLYFLGVILFSLSVFLLKEHDFSKKKVLIAISIFIIGCIYKNIHIQSPFNGGTLTGIVIKSSSNYIIVFDGLERFYVPLENNTINIFSIVQIDGSKPSFFSSNVKYENGFNFQTYLNNSGIYRQIYPKMYTQLFNSYINCSTYFNNVISLYNSEKSKEIVSLLFFGETDYLSQFYISLKNFGLSYIFSSSGIFLSFIKSKIVSFLSEKIGYKKAQIISMILLAPILFIKIDSFIVRRIVLSFLVNTILYKYLSKIEKISLIYSLLLIDKYAINQSAFYIPLTIVLFMNFSSLYLKQKAKYLKNFYQSIIVYLIMIPFLASFNNSLNLLTFLLNIAFLSIFKYQYLFLYPSLLMLKIPFIEKVLDFEYDIFSFSGFKYFSINFPEMNINLSIFYYLFLIIFIAYKEINFKRIYKVGLIGFTSILIINLMPITQTIFNEVSFINVGQGDATYIRYNNKNYLIDTGGNVKDDLATNCLIPFLRKKKVYYLDAVFITHYDIDHYYALDSLKKNFIVKSVYDYNNFTQYNGNLIVYNLNSKFNEFVEENSRSLVYHFSISNFSFLIMGDATIEIEKNIINEFPNLKVDYLKVGHHGSNTSSSYEFLKSLSPKEAIISCGVNNIYHHPHEEVINNLNKLKIKIRRTDKEGTISYIFCR